MKVLSLKQPFAELILQGRKTIELRKWNTKLRGEFLIHASKNPDAESMKKFEFNELPCGFIVGSAELIGVKHYADDNELQGDNDKHLADSGWGEYGFALKNIERFKKPIPAQGKMGFWEFERKT